MSSDGTSTHRLDTAHRLRRSVAVAVATLVAGVAFGLPGPTSHAAALDHDEGLSTGDPTVGTRFASGLSVSGGDRAVVASWPRQRVKGLRISLRGHKTGRGGRVLPRWAKWGRARQLHAKATRFVFKGLRNGREYQVKPDVLRGSRWRTMGSGFAVANAPRFTPGPIHISPRFGADSGGKVLLRSMASRSVTRAVTANTNDACEISFSSDGSRMIYQDSDAIDDGAINIVELAAESLARLDGGSHPAFSPDGGRALSDGDGAAVTSLVDDSTKPVSTSAGGVPANGTVFHSAFMPDGTRIVFVSAATNPMPK